MQIPPANNYIGNTDIQYLEYEGHIKDKQINYIKNIILATTNKSLFFKHYYISDNKNNKKTIITYKYLKNHQ